MLTGARVRQLTGLDARRPREDKVNNEPPGSTPNRLRKEVEEAYRELSTPLLQYLRSMGCRHFQAEEIVQEVFLRFHRWRREGIKIRDRRGWVFRVAHNLCIDSHRDSRRLWSIDTQEGSRPPTQADPALDPERRVLHEERSRLIENEVARLPELQRECLRRRRQGDRYHEIGAALHISAAAAAECVRQAVKTLKKRARF